MRVKGLLWIPDAVWRKLPPCLTIGTNMYPRSSSYWQILNWSVIFFLKHSLHPHDFLLCVTKKCSRPQVHLCGPRQCWGELWKKPYEEVRHRVFLSVFHPPKHLHLRSELGVSLKFSLLYSCWCHYGECWCSSAVCSYWVSVFFFAVSDDLIKDCLSILYNTCICVSTTAVEVCFLGHPIILMCYSNNFCFLSHIVKVKSSCLALCVHVSIGEPCCIQTSNLQLGMDAC